MRLDDSALYARHQKGERPRRTRTHPMRSAFVGGRFTEAHDRRIGLAEVCACVQVRMVEHLHQTALGGRSPYRIVELLLVKGEERARGAEVALGVERVQLVRDV